MTSFIYEILKNKWKSLKSRVDWWLPGAEEVVGEMGEAGQRFQTSSYKINKLEI